MTLEHALVALMYVCILCMTAMVVAYYLSARPGGGGCCHSHSEPPPRDDPLFVPEDWTQRVP